MKKSRRGREVSKEKGMRESRRGNGGDEDDEEEDGEGGRKGRNRGKILHVRALDESTVASLPAHLRACHRYNKTGHLFGGSREAGERVSVRGVQTSTATSAARAATAAARAATAAATATATAAG
eukprot:CAMPEP_0202086244 /NCGR_PEP_ID=MMETSP0964-20121228/32967_1 /ASSEMBLY_ACC=CAM_ASM_000500 /TAXON_ID=4773 /ORGANISM="Schizochytrium aggregatum, Strain ATCC28209" /LENGTH=123 /DNA_ID=CAMNT_0048654129 /DNA_START=50 /DNA_END=417 /DNA_ORIENTATION=-